MKIFKNAWFSRFARKEKISVNSLREAVSRAQKGQFDANLGGGVIKQRISRPGEGRSKGYRSILLFCKDEKAFFVYGFPKSNLANIRDDEENAFKKMAQYVLALNDAQLNELIANGQFEEVEENGKEISQ